MKKRFLFLVGIGVLLAMSSCSKDEENLVVKSGEPATLTLTIKGNNVSTRISGSLPDYNSTEGKINDVIVGLFDASGNTDVISYGTLVDNKITIKGTPGPRTIIVVANPNSATQFAGTTNITDFRHKSLILPSTQVSDDLPMAGETTYTLVANSTVSTSITVKRLVARVQLIGLSTQFDPNGQYNNATFQATKVFMFNAMSKSYVDGTVTSEPWQGWSNTLLLPSPLVTPTFNLSLGNDLNLAFPGATYSPNNYFYTFANILPAAQSVTELNNATRLVIQGEFDPDGSGTSFAASTVYYPIIVNRDVTPTIEDSGITRNNIYSYTVVIKNKGVNDPITILDPASITLTVSVDPWITYTDQSVEF